VSRGVQTLVGVGVVGLGALLATGALGIPSDAGYAGVAGALLACGGLLLWEASSGGFRFMGEQDGAAHGDWAGFAWVSAAILSNAALITTIGFILSCTLCFVLAVRGFKASEGRLDLGLRSWVVDAAIGAAISAPVYWMFTKALSINLPGLTGTGWL
jgi:putative tricarboxylic transport membrane protein